MAGDWYTGGTTGTPVTGRGVVGTPAAGSEVLEGDDRIEAGEGGLVGFFVNGFRDLGDMATGVGAIVGAGIHDVKELATVAGSAVGGDADYSGNYVLDDLYGVMTGASVGKYAEENKERGSAIWNDFQERYGPETGILGGHFSQVYENPLAFISDALTVATAGGAAAGKVGQLGKAGKAAKSANLAEYAGGGAAKASGAVDDTARVVATAEQVEAARLAGAADPVAAAQAAAEFAARRSVAGKAAVEALTPDEVGRLQGLAQTIQGSVRRYHDPVTGKVESVLPVPNPVRRALYQDVYERLSTHSTPWLKAKAAKYAEVAENGGPKAAAAVMKRDRYQAMFEEANRLNATHTIRPRYAATKAKKLVDFTVGLAAGKSTATADRVSKSIDDNFGDLGDTIPDEQIVDNLYGTDPAGLTDDGIVAPEGRGTRRAEVFDEVGPGSFDDGQSPAWAGPEGGYSSEGRAVTPEELAAARTTGRQALEADRFAAGTTGDAWELERLPGVIARTEDRLAAAKRTGDEASVAQLRLELETAKARQAELGGSGSGPDSDAVSLEWRRHQDAEVEAIPKDLENRQLGMALEHAMDIGREVALKGAGRAGELGYAAEKVRRLRAIFAESRNTALGAADQARLAELVSKFDEGFPGRNPALDEVEELTRALASGDFDQAARVLDNIEQRLMGKGASGAGVTPDMTVRELPDGTVEVTGWHGTRREVMPWENPDDAPFQSFGVHIGTRKAARSRLLQRTKVRQPGDDFDAMTHATTFRGQVFRDSTGQPLYVSDDGAHAIAEVRAGRLYAVRVQDDGFVSRIVNKNDLPRHQQILDESGGRILRRDDLQDFDAILYENAFEAAPQHTGGPAQGSLLIVEDAVRAGKVARAEALTPLPEDLIAPLLREQWGGGTWDPRTGRFLDVEDGYTGGSVPNSETVTLSIDDAQDADKLMTAVRQAEEKFAAELERPNRYLGVFRDDKTGKVTIEPSIHVKSRETAEAIATELDAKGGFYDHGTGDGVFPLRDQHTTRVPEPGTPERAALDAARQRAQASVVQTAPALRAALEGEAKVIAGPVKSIRSIRRKAELNNGDWTGVDDIERYRLVAEDAWEPTKLQRLIDQVKETTGGTVRRIENSIGSPDDHGARGFRMVVEMPDGHAAEFSILTPDAMHVIDNTKMLHQVRTVLAARLARGGLDPRQEAQIAMELRMAEALSQQMWEGVTDGMRAARGGPAANSLRQRINRFRVDLWGETADPLLDRGLSIESAFENAHAAQRLRNGATHDPDQGWTGISSLELDALNAAEGKMAPVYYPHMDARLLPERGSLLRRNVRAGSGLGQDVNLKQNTLEVLQAGRESKDFRQVYRIRAEQAGRMRERMDVLFDLIDEYGRPIARPGDLRPDEVLFAPGLAKRLSGQHQAMLDSLATDPTGKGLGDMLDRFTAANAAELERLVSTGGDLEAFAVPKVVADRLRQHTKWIPDDRVQLLAGTTTDMWKGAVLSGSPRWMVNNLLGNVIFTKLQGNVPLGRVVRQLNKKYLARMREAIGPEALARIESGGQVKSLAAKARPVGDDVVSGVAGAIERNIGQRAVPRALRRYSAWAQRVNGSMEDAFRRASYLTAAEREAARLSVDSVGRRFWNSKKALEDAYRVGLDETRWTRAVDEMNSFMNDYQTATPFSRNIVKPYLVPFWSFYRHAAKMVLQMPFQHPAKATLLRQIAEADEERYRREGIDPQSMPGWLKGSALFTGRGEAGDFRFMSTAGMNPFNAVLDSPLNALHPASKMLYEQAMGRSTFTNRPFTDPNVQTAPFSDNAYRAEMRDGKPVMVPVTGTRPGLLEHALQQIPQYEMLKDVIAGGTTYDTSTIYDALRGRVGLGESALLTDSEGEPVTEKSAADMLARLFGYGTFDSDLERNMEFTAEEREKALEQWLEKHRTEDDSTEAATGSSWYG